MSSLTDIDKRYLEKILVPAEKPGFVLDFTDATFGEFFKRHKINIHGQKYQTYGTSKAKKLRAFWEQESNQLVSKVLTEMLDSYEANCELNDHQKNDKILKKSREIISRLSGNKNSSAAPTESSFLDQEFTIPNLHKLPIEPQVAIIIKARVDEARLALRAKAYLSVIFLCGSVLEGVLLGTAQNNPAKFNKAHASPKDKNGLVRQFQCWNLAQFIDVACEIELLKLDVKKFGHGLRDFRNYIHPYQQMVSGFTPDEHTAKVCFQVLKAALASLAGERK